MTTIINCENEICKNNVDGICNKSNIYLEIHTQFSVKTLVCNQFEKDCLKNLCDTCKNQYPSCSGTILKFGNGIGNDNVIKCDAYAIALDKITYQKEDVK